MKIDISTFLIHFLVHNKILNEIHDCISHKKDKQLPGIIVIRMMLFDVKGRVNRKYQYFNSWIIWGTFFAANREGSQG